MKIVLLIWMIIGYHAVFAQNFCGDILSNSTGWFASPDIDQDGEYDFNYRCTWIIRVPDNKVILIEFLEFDLEESLKCQYDYLTIRDGNTKVGHYCGTTISEFVSEARLVFIDFRSDGFINRRGFNATYTELDDVNCGYQTWAIAGQFGSFDTDISFDCLWTIRQQKHVPAIQIYIAEMRLQWTEDCDYFIEVSNDNETVSLLCGGSPPSPPMTSVSNVLYVHLRAPPNVKFLVYYSTTDVNATFGGILPYNSGVFTATDYNNDGMYDHNANTIWVIVAPEYHVIRLEVKDIHIHSGFSSCAGDSLKIYDGYFEVGEEEMEICGFFIEDIQMVSYNRVVFAHFVTNSWYSGLGFNATYRHTLGRVHTVPNTVSWLPKDISTTSTASPSTSVPFSLTASMSTMKPVPIIHQTTKASSATVVEKSTSHACLLVMLTVFFPVF